MNHYHNSSSKTQHNTRSQNGTYNEGGRPRNASAGAPEAQTVLRKQQKGALWGRATAAGCGAALPNVLSGDQVDLSLLNGCVLGGALCEPRTGYSAVDDQ